MTYRLRLWLTSVAVLACGPGPATAGFVTQTFDTDPGWAAVGSGANANAFGHRPSGFAGGSAGEAGGRFTRSAFARYYADTASVGRLTLAGPLAAAGRFDVTGRNVPDFGPGLLLGHFRTTGPAGIGLMFNNNGTGDLHWSAAVFFDDGSVLLSDPTAVAANVDRSWSYAWDPGGGSFGGGMLTAALTGPGGGTRVLDLDPALRARGVSADAFGLSSGRTPAASGNPNRPDWYADVFIDDVSYSVVSPVPSPVPPPPTLVLLAVGPVLGVAARRRRGRPLPEAGE